jgi:hypothetical protein
MFIQTLTFLTKVGSADMLDDGLKVDPLLSNSRIDGSAGFPSGCATLASTTPEGIDALAEIAGRSGRIWL